MKQQLLERYLNLGSTSKLHIAPQVKEYLSSAPEEDPDNPGKEVINMIFPGNSTKNFEIRLKDEDMQPIAIPYMSAMNNIQIIDLQFNRITDKGLSIICKLFEKAENMKHLNLKGNHIGDTGCEELKKALIKKQKLTYLNLNTNIFGNAGLKAISLLLVQNESLKYLDVGYNRYDWDGIISVTFVIRARKENLEVLIMDDPAYKIQDQSFFAHFGQMIEANKNKPTGLKKLSLRHNQIRWEALNIICYKLVDAHYLTVLDLSGNELDFQAAIHLRDYLSSKNFELTSLNLSHNKLYDSGCKILSDGLANNSKLIHLDITGNSIHDEGFTYFAQKLLDSEVSNIKSLKIFWDNQFGDNSIEILNKLLKKKGNDFYPDFLIEMDYDPEPKNQKLCIAYLETHIPDEDKYTIPL